MLLKSDPETASHLLHEAEKAIARRLRQYTQLATI
jgi:hypothetical protein